MANILNTCAFMFFGLEYLAVFALETWTVAVKTSGTLQAGSSAKISINIYGLTGDIKETGLGSDMFSRGSLQNFTLQGNIGRPYKIKLKNNGRKETQNWCFDYVRLSCGSLAFSFKHHKFGCVWVWNGRHVYLKINPYFGSYKAFYNPMDVKMTASLFWQTKSKCLGECAILCYKNHECKSFTFNSQHQECQSHREKFSTVDEGQGQMSEGFVYYSQP